MTPSLLETFRVLASFEPKRTDLSKAPWEEYTDWAIGQGMATAHACEGLARNPGAEAAIRFALILGLVLIESMALYTFAIISLKVK